MGGANATGCLYSEPDEADLVPKCFSMFYMCLGNFLETLNDIFIIFSSEMVNVLGQVPFTELLKQKSEPDRN